MLHEDTQIKRVQIGVVIALFVVAGGAVAYEQLVVDSQRRTAELTHSRQVGDQFQQLHSTIGTVASGNRNAPASVPLTLGTSYGSGALFGGPGATQGRLRTVGTNGSAAVTVSNVAIRNETGDFLNGTRRYPTGLLVYEPGYNYYTDAPRTVYENGVLYNLWNDSSARGRETETSGPVSDVPSTVLAHRPVVRGRTISLVTLGGQIQQEAAGRQQLTVEPRSVSTRTVPVRNESGESIVVTMPTRLSEQRWQWLLRNETKSYGGHVTGIAVESRPSKPFDSLVVRLEPGPAYRLRVARVGLGEQQQRPPARYIVPVEGANASVGEGRTRRVTVEVRDRFNNPVSDVRVAAAGNVSRRVVRADERGTAAFVYQAPENIDGRAQRVQLNFSIVANPAASGAFDASTPVNASVDLWVRNTNGSTDGTSERGAFDVDLETPSFLGSCTPRCRWDLSQDRPGPNHEFDLTAVVEAPSYSGLAVNFSTNDTSLVSLYQRPNERLRGGESATTRVIANGTGVVELRATVGNETDTATLRLTDATERIASPSLRVVPDSATASSGGGVAARGQFTIENTSPNELRLDEIVFVNTTAAQVAGVQVWNLSSGYWADEIYVETESDVSGRSVDGILKVYSKWLVGSSARFTDTPVLAPGARATFYVNDFVDASGDPVSIRGERAQFGLRYETPTFWRGSEEFTVTFD